MHQVSENPGGIRGEVSGKVQGIHLDRLAVIYVRQSTIYQVEHHQESARLQYALKERAIQLGWSPQRVIVIDEDQGHSGGSAEGRTGFQQLVAEVGLNHVGGIFGIEVSRLARSNRDWYQLLDMCALFRTLISDVDGIYDSSNYNDRLLLGLKGTMSEAELHILKQRLNAGKWSKARRGELVFPVPIGYWRRPSGEVMKDPDTQAQAVVELVFATFARCRTINGVLRYLVEHGIALPVRERCGVEKGNLRWSRPSRSTLRNMLTNPVYAGAYVYGRRPVDPLKQQAGHPGTGRTETVLGEWEVCLKDRLPAYLTWGEYERNQRQIAANQSQARGVPRQGASLVAGLLVCGRCGQRMTTHYTNNGDGLRYACDRQYLQYREASCQSLSGAPVDEVVSRLVLQALEPLALDLSLQVAEDLEAERAQVLEQWHYRLERAQYEVERAFRQYNTVEPEHRLVARQLEQQWEEALQAEDALQREYERVVAQHPVPLSVEEREAIRHLAGDLPALWHAPTTTAAERQAIVRQLIERVVVTVQGESEQVTVEIQWAGGSCTQTTVIRPVARWEQLSFYPTLVRQVKALVAEGRQQQPIARLLTQKGWHGPRGEGPVTVSMVQRVLMREGEPNARALQESEGFASGTNEWTADTLAQTLAMPRDTLYNWLHQGTLTARRVVYRGHPRWVIWADEAEVARLRTLHEHTRRGPSQRGEAVEQDTP
jgi:DNA invertase Pin-like site-specific DNA recombinase